MGEVQYKEGNAAHFSSAEKRGAAPIKEGSRVFVVVTKKSEELGRASYIDPPTPTGLGPVAACFGKKQHTSVAAG
jgi:hypothetical protein